MAKKKKKNKKKSYSFLQTVDSDMNQTYDDLIDEITSMQSYIDYADKKKRKKNKKKLERGENTFYETDRSLKARKRVYTRMEESSFIDRIMMVIKDIKPIITIIGRLVAALILSLLSLDSVKKFISKTALQKIDRVYRLCLNV